MQYQLHQIFNNNRTFFLNQKLYAQNCVWASTSLSLPQRYQIDTINGTAINSKTEKKNNQNKEKAEAKKSCLVHILTLMDIIHKYLRL